MRLVRAGSQSTVHLYAYHRYRAKLVSSFDLVVDEVNTIPFFTPLWARIPSVMLIHQLAREVWWFESPFPVNVLGYLAEPIYLRRYLDTHVVTVSNSTRDDLLHLGLRGPITVVSEGIEPVGSMSESKAAQPTFLYVGRLAPSKRIGHILEAFAKFRHQNSGSGQLWLIGTGADRYRRALMETARTLGIDSHVLFHGRVSTQEKHRLMARAHALLMTSVREGWGLVVSEASACGTPAIVYDVGGLRDSVRDELTGLIVPPRSDSLAHAMTRITSDSELYARLVANGLEWSRTLSFDETAAQVGHAFDEAAAARK